jgi:hypothetical protein
MGCQVVHESQPGREFGDLFSIRVEGRVAGDNFVMGYRDEPQDMVKEFYVLSTFRGSVLPPPKLPTVREERAALRALLKLQLPKSG